jgi:putative MATE family efflux protein
MIRLPSPLAHEETRIEFFRRLIFLALPIMLQYLLVSSVSFIDTVMIGMVSEPAIAAVGLGNQMFFLMTLFFFGVSSGAAIFTAQYWGAGDRNSLHKVMGIALMFSYTGAFATFLLSVIFPDRIIQIFTDDPTVIALGADYIRIVALSYLFTAAVMVYSASLRSTGDAKTPLYISVCAMILNVLLNYLLILGKGGFPRLEVKGAAIATVIARGAEMVLLLMIIYRKQKPAAAPLKLLFGFDSALVKKYIHTCLPVILNEVFWSLGMATYKVAYSRMGVQVIASVNVTESIQNLFFVVLSGITHASAILIGNRIGENDLGLAKKYASRLLLTGLTTGIALGALLAFFAPWLSLPFNLSDEVALMTTRSLLALGVLVPLKAYNMVLVVGVLRAGGDTRFSMFAELSGVWLIGVPCAFVGALLLHIPIWYLYLFVGLEEVFKFIAGVLRIKSGKWINRLTEDHLAPPL